MLLDSFIRQRFTEILVQALHRFTAFVILYAVPLRFRPPLPPDCDTGASIRLSTEAFTAGL